MVCGERGGRAGAVGAAALRRQGGGGGCVAQGRLSLSQARGLVRAHLCFFIE